jgi:hypothetical protein
MQVMTSTCCFVCESGEAQLTLQIIDCDVLQLDGKWAVSARCLCVECGKSGGIYTPCGNMKCYVMVLNAQPDAVHVSRHRPRHSLCSDCVMSKVILQCLKCKRADIKLSAYHVPECWQDEHATTDPDDPMDEEQKSSAPPIVLCKPCASNPRNYQVCQRPHCWNLRDSEWDQVARNPSNIDRRCASCSDDTVCQQCNKHFSSMNAEEEQADMELTPAQEELDVDTFCPACFALCI